MLLAEGYEDIVNGDIFMFQFERFEFYIFSARLGSPK